MPAELETTEYAITERGKKITHSQEEVDHALTLLAEVGGSQTLAAGQLKEEGFKTINSEKLRKWRDNCFPHRYLQLSRDASPQISEKIAGSLLERAIQADKALKRYIEVSEANVENVPPEQQAKNALALASAQADLDQGAHTCQIGRNNPQLETLSAKRLGTNPKYDHDEQEGQSEDR